jgi:hypothetical protein
MAGLLAAARAPVRLARGQVEAPEQVLDLAEQVADRDG